VISRETLREALFQYGRHADNCSGDAGACVCGWNQLVLALSDEPRTGAPTAHEAMAVKWATAMTADDAEELQALIVDRR
jgi:hypothetical protein